MGEFGIPMDKYKDYLITCVHDTNHDFFENTDPMDDILHSEMKGGAITHKTMARTLSLLGEDDGGSRPTKYQRQDLSPLADDTIILEDDDSEEELMESDEELMDSLILFVEHIELYDNIYNFISSDITDRVNHNYISIEGNETIIDSIDTKIRNLKRPRSEEDMIRDGVSDGVSVSEGVSVGEGVSVSDGVSISEGVRPQKRQIRPLSSVDSVDSVMKGGSRRTSRVRTLPEDKKNKIIEAKSKLKIIVDKIKEWDTYSTLISFPDSRILLSDPEKQKYKDLQIINEENAEQDDTVNGVKGGSQMTQIITFYEWLTLPPHPKCKIMDEIIEFISADMKIKDDLILRNYTLYEMLDKVWDKDEVTDDILDDLLILFKIVKKFSLYTSHDMGGDTHLTINIDSFIKKKWNKFRTKVRLNAASAVLLLNSLFTKPGKNVKLTEDEKNQIKIFKNKVMKGWLLSIGIVNNDDMSDWAKEEYAKVEKPDVQLTDASFRDSFMRSEFPGFIQGRKLNLNGFHEWHGHPCSASDKDVAKELLNVSDASFSVKATGNNASAVKFYTAKPLGAILKKPFVAQTDPIIGHKKKYNCNAPNVGDPASSCPELNENIIGNPFTIKVNVIEPTGTVVPNFGIEFKMDGMTPKDLTKCKMSYKIENGGNKLEINGYPVNTRKGGHKVEGLSKTTVLRKVFDDMIDIIREAGQVPKTTYSEILKQYNELPKDKNKMTKIIQDFCLKLFGDHGQELLSAALSVTGPTVYFGNDWISHVRSCFLMKYMIRPNGIEWPWWCAFLGNKSHSILRSPQPSSKDNGKLWWPSLAPGPGPGPGPTKKKKKKRKSKKKSKKSKRKKYKKSKRKSKRK